MLLGKYRVERSIASGGMGVVVLVRHEVLGQRFAAKLLRRGDKQGPAVERFLREARAAAILRSDHVARVFDVGALDDGTPVMLMEFLEGRDLADEIRARGAIPLPEAVDYVLQALEAIAEAHRLGIVHRDLKPGNIFLVTKPDGGRTVKVLDFGISKVSPLAAIEGGAVSTGDTLLGSPAYMSPEQVRSSRDVDGRTDLWSLGLVLYELVTGGRAFDGNTTGEILAFILTTGPRPISLLVPDLPPGFEAVVERCLDRDRDRRYPTAEALRDALLPFGTGRMSPAAGRSSELDRGAATRVSVPPERVASGTQTTVQLATTHTQPRLEPPLSSSPRSRVPLLIAGATGLAVLLLAALLGRAPAAPPAIRGLASSAPSSSAPSSSARSPSARSPSAEPAVSAVPAPTDSAAAPSVSAAAPSASAPPRPRVTKPLAPRASAAPKPLIDLERRD
jgi:serine/threonine-protein kinase